MEKVFIFKEVNSDDRDAVNYIEVDKIGKLECGHYFPRINLTGLCFSRRFDIPDCEVKSVLTMKDFESIKNYNDTLDDIGRGIEYGDDRYNAGIEAYGKIKPVIKKLLSDENHQLFNEVVEEEIQFISGKYKIDYDEVKDILEEYGNQYKDRSIVNVVFEDLEECAREEAFSMGYVNKENDLYFHYEKFGEDLLDEERYIELSDERIAVLEID